MPTQNVDLKRVFRTFLILLPELTRGRGRGTSPSPATSPALIFFPQAGSSGSSFDLCPSPKLTPNSEKKLWDVLHSCLLWCTPKVGARLQGTKGSVCLSCFQNPWLSTHTGNARIHRVSPNFPMYLNNLVRASLLSDPECGKSCQGEEDRFSSSLGGPL